MTTDNLFEKFRDGNDFITEASNVIFDFMVKLNIDRYDLEDADLSILMPIKTTGLNFKSLGIKDIHIDKNNFRIAFYSLSTKIHLTLEDDIVIGLSNLPISEMYILLRIIEVMEHRVKRYQDETNANIKKIHFENRDIIITDPCYIIKYERTEYSREVQEASWKNIEKFVRPLEKERNEFLKSLREKWRETPPASIAEIAEAKEKDREYNRKINELKKKYELEIIDDTKYKPEEWGLTNYIVRDTIYGDWSCHTFNSDTKEIIGQFCADSGMVGVFDLEEVLRYNPDFVYYLDKHHTTTLIKNFTGDVWFEVETHDSGLGKWKDLSVHVIGRGNINFKTEQTGL